MAKALQTIHFDINIRINEDTWGWSKPNVSTDLDFHIPAELFVPQSVANMINSRVNDLLKQYPEAVLEYEAEQVRKEAEKQAEESEVEGE